MDKILTVNDVAGILQVKAITVREMFRENRLRGFKVGKAWRTTREMLKEDIDALARGEAPEPAPKPAAASTEKPKRAKGRPKKTGDEALPQPERAKKPRKTDADGHAGNNSNNKREEVEDSQQLLF